MTYDELTQKVQDALSSSSGFLKQVETTLAVVWELCEIAKNHDDEYLAQVIAAANQAQADLNARIAEFETWTAEKQAEFTQIKTDCETALAAIETLKAEVLAKLAAQDERLNAQDAIIDGLIKAYVYQTGQDFRQYDFAIYAGKIYQATAPFTAGGNFVNDLQKYMKPLAQDNKVITYAAGVDIEEGQNVLYENAGTGSLYVALKSFTASGTFADDAANLINYSSGIDLSDFYNKQEVSDMLATKQDKLTQGDGVMVVKSATATTVSADMSQTSTALKLAQRNGQGQLLAKTPNNASGEVLVNADYLNSTITSLRAEFLLTENKTWSVGASGTYTTLKAALEAASKYQNTTKNGSTFTITIQLLADFVWAETIYLRNIDLSFVSITRANTSKNVPIKTSALSTINVEGLDNITCALILENAKISFGSVWFEVQNEASVTQINIQYFFLYNNSVLTCSNFVLDTTKYIASQYISLVINQNSSLIVKNQFKLLFDNAQRLSYDTPVYLSKITSNSILSAYNIEIDGNEIAQTPSKKSYVIQILSNSSLIASYTYSLDVKNISHCIVMSDNSLLFTNGDASFTNILVAISMENSIFHCNRFFYAIQNFTDDTYNSSSFPALQATFSRVLALQYFFQGTSCVYAVDSDLFFRDCIYGITNQPQANIKNVWYFVVEGGTLYANSMVTRPASLTADLYYTINTTSGYSGILNFGKGCKVSVNYIRMDGQTSSYKATIQWLKSGDGETAANYPKGIVCLDDVDFRYGVAENRIINSLFIKKWIVANADGTYTYADYGNTAYDVVALPNSLSFFRQKGKATSNLTATMTANGIMVNQS